MTQPHLITTFLSISNVFKAGWYIHKKPQLSLQNWPDKGMVMSLSVTIQWMERPSLKIHGSWGLMLSCLNLKNPARFHFFTLSFSQLFFYEMWMSGDCHNTKSREPEKINVKFHKNCENTSKILKISCVRCHFVKFDIYFLGISQEIFFGVITDN